MSTDSNAHNADIPEMADIPLEISEIDTLRAERDDMRDRFMRALADAENSRKRSERPQAQ